MYFYILIVMSTFIYLAYFWIFDVFWEHTLWENMSFKGVNMRNFLLLLANKLLLGKFPIMNLICLI